MVLKSDGRVSIVFQPAGKKIETEGGSLLELAREAGIELRSDCGGKGTCGKCRVLLVRARCGISGLTGPERKILSQKELEEGYRLACQLKVDSGSLTVFVPEESRMEVRKIDESCEGYVRERKVLLSPAIRKIHLKLSPPSLSDPLPDFERVRSLIGDVQIPLNLLRNLPKLLRDSDWNVTAVVWNEMLIGLEKGNTASSMFGIAVDIGSSKIIVHLIDLVSGETVARGSAENPQVAYGEDIVSRITYASKSNENFRKLQKLLIDTVNDIVDRLCRDAGIESGQIYEAVVVGNSAMHHFFFGIYPRYISVSPFTPAVRKSMSYPAREVGLNINQEGYAVSLPLIAGFIGSDAVSNLISTGLHEMEETCMILDIGTNTEILLGSRDRILACSAPSGPAFEGAHIRHGMKAVSGAIEKVRIRGDEVIYRTIDGVKPKGICGSGMIDLVAELYREGIISSRGKFVKDVERVVWREKLPEFVVAFPEETETGRAISVTERDINEFLMAKGAIKAGWKILSDRFGIEPEEISRIFVAGSFGRHISVENAKLIGLLPDIAADRITFAGDSAVVGAKIALKSVHERVEIERVVENIEYVELSAERDFYSAYIRSVHI